MNYYKEIKDHIINNELTKKAKDYSKTRSDLTTYYNVGKLLVEAGKHYGEGIIKEYSKKLTTELGKGYTETNLKYFRQFYSFSNSHTVCDELTWSHYRLLLSIFNKNELEYYMLICKKQSLSVRKLQEKIKSNEYERLDTKTKQKLEQRNELNIFDYVKNPILVKNSYNYTEISERILQKLILEDISSFMKELGNNFSFIDSEHKIKIGNTYNYVDLLLYNIEFNCYVVIELKITELKKEYIGQVEIYMSYIDNNLKTISQEKTIGIIICKKDNKYIMEYCSDKRIITKEYELL